MKTLNIPSTFKVTEDQFEVLAAANRELHLERNKTGELIIMPPTGGNTGKRNAQISAQFVVWNNKTKLGEVFDSSTAFRLPNGAERSPDVSWVKLARWNQLTEEQQDTFPPLCPDFVVELGSPTDTRESLRQKMQEYRENGTRLGWLIDPKKKIVEIYRPEQTVELLQSPSTLSGEDILPGFVLDMQQIL
ncbi:MAG: Uma2 family endonuclease [Gomphosphaeria aponina SAG 52.96 = DSM 107014]|uniref:Uma2 family endonuclease n=1 Tax=Gomphosphaeria aponina SAG 52.96 = DSM 107014 TaxID=1521640 RepID=A0A941GMP1_9CHRO|nr:Uma2 family endonuclease [Gomphosphaeria aponina SAG 52.96 = DSM 107014]